MKTQRAQRSCAASFSSTWTRGLKLGHVGKVNIHVLRRCMWEGTRMRTYDDCVLLHEEDEEIQHSQHDDQ